LVCDAPALRYILPNGTLSKQDLAALKAFIQKLGDWVTELEKTGVVPAEAV
jgi:hypothetical protein